MNYSKSIPLFSLALIAGTLVMSPAYLAEAAGLAQPVASAPLAAAPTQAELKSIAETLKPSAAVVEYSFQYDKADSPGGDWGGSRFSGEDRAPSGNWEQFIRDERPAERPAYIIAADKVVVADIKVHPRFIKSINVRFGDQVVSAKPAGFAVEHNAVLLQLDKPLTGVKPLAFDASKAPPYISAAFRESEGAWAISVGSGGGSRVTVGRNGKTTSAAPTEAILLDRSGTPVAISMNGELAVDDSWKGSPEKWKMLSADELAKTLADTEAAANKLLPRVALSFRSPRQGQSGGGRGRGGEEQESAMTEFNGTAVMLDASTALVLANFKPKVSARLETIKLSFPGQTKAVNAKFAGTLKDYGGFLVTLETPVADAGKLTDKSVLDLRDTLLAKAEITVLGETRNAYYGRERINGFMVGWRRNIYPAIGYSREAGYRPSAGGSRNFVFTATGDLAVVPIERREKVTIESRSSYYAETPIMVHVGEIRSAISNKAEALDTENRPLTEAEENRLAWLGVEMQPMDEDLARLNNVADQTAGGRSGGIVTYVYADSPASTAGVEVGDIMLRLHVKGQPKPLDVDAQGGGGPADMMEKFWEFIDQVPDEYLDQVPKPWGNAETTLTRSLTDIGFGTQFTADVFRNGQVISKEFKIEQGPANYGSAGRIKHEPSGISARDLTYEVRRYFQIEAKEPGVIVAKVEKGSKAAVAGIKMYEIILSVNDQPVNSTADMEKAFAVGGDMKLAVKRMTEGRTVKFKLPVPKSDKPAEAKDEKPADKPADKPVKQPAAGPAGDPGKK